MHTTNTAATPAHAHAHRVRCLLDTCDASPDRRNALASLDELERLLRKREQELRIVRLQLDDLQADVKLTLKIAKPVGHNAIPNWVVERLEAAVKRSTEED